MPEAVGSTIAFGTSPIEFDMVTFKPPTNDSGDGIPATTLKNTEVETFDPPTLKKVQNGEFEADIKAASYPAIQAAVGVKQQITIRVPIPGSNQKLQGVGWGWLKSFTPGSGTFGARWTGNGIIIWGNKNAAGAETKIAWTVV